MGKFRGTERGGKVGVGAVLVGIGILAIVLLQGASAEPPKDVTLVRPKHLKYASYRTLQQNETSEEAEIKRQRRKSTRANELHSEEREHPSSHYPNGSLPLDPSSSATSLKRSLLPTPGIDHSHGSRTFGSPFGITKSPPDLQFGLAFTVPFVSLSTDKLLNTFSGKSAYSGEKDVSSILKLNLGGLIAAIIVGIGAFFLVPGLLHPGKFGGNGFGWGGSLLDSIFPHGVPGFLDQFLGGGLGSHFGGGGGGGDGWAGSEDGPGRPFGYGDYYEYNGIHNHNRKDTSAVLREKSSRREGRSGAGNSNVNGTAASVPTSDFLGHLVSSVSSYAKKYVTTAQGCIKLQICRKGAKDKKEGKGKKGEEDLDLLSLVESLSENELVKDSPLSQEIRKAHEHGKMHGECKQFEKPECA